MEIYFEEDCVVIIDNQQTDPDGMPLVFELSFEEYEEMVAEGIL